MGRNACFSGGRTLGPVGTFSALSKAECRLRMQGRDEVICREVVACRDTVCLQGRDQRCMHRRGKVTGRLNFGLRHRTLKGLRPNWKERTS